MATYKFIVYVDNRVIKIDKDITKFKHTLRILEEALATFFFLDFNKEINIGLNLISATFIRKLNREYRHFDSATDVLSFNFNEKIGENLYLGELYLSPSFIRRMARRFNVTFEYEFWQDLIHGVLHLHGFVHGTAMFDLQNMILRSILV